MTKELTDIQFPFFNANVRNPKPISNVTLEYILNLIRYSNKDLKYVFEKLNTTVDRKERSKLKERLYHATPAVILDGTGRGYKNIVGFTGLLVLDFDKIHNAPEFKQFLFDEYDFIIAAWLSSSKKGVRALVNIPKVNSTSEYKALFWGLANNEMMQYNGFDIAPQNAVLPMFISYDPDLLFRTDASIWDTPGRKPNEINETPEVVIPYRNDSRFEQWSINEFERKINGITDYGHPVVRAAAFTLGGRVGAGYIDLITAVNVAERAIAMNGYLSKGTKGYQKTAREMIEKGRMIPLEFKKR